MNPFYKIGIIALVVTAAFLSGFFYGREFERATTLKNAANAYQSASEIQNEVNHLSDYALCIALGGLPNKCQVFLRGLDKATLNQ
ncbi:hypothetical protein N5853_09465 [Bartonella sp. HY329]|uniref:hypothetical protein n=1 Tax=unclassified Bartonella TaxID=2645622 RepID=UPI0021C97A85|nr:MULTISPECIES: hypothetical protein [unclassified Bartonella]UXM94335.1 hypothetical protein N5853_09465 [Bartonella sp. HY329]UXN08658.1 hypothetical protein N5852_09475 [Bartonella sp. HY328]